ncbi:MAG TPA: peptide deformylase [Verrucomicrobiae bacterium]|nr:peptide deformylase [Verrucomicrobiae bacterium]
MVLHVVKYGDPVLRRKGARIEKMTPEIKQLIADMFETMKAARGVGLAAQQVGHALQLCVIDIREVTDRPSTLKLNGKESDPNEFMPLTLINPTFVQHGEPVAGPEGCLSFPEIYSDIERPPEIDVTAQNEKGETIKFYCGGLLARAIQHEYDHLQGILFIDRMSRELKLENKPDIDAVQADTKRRLQKKSS